MKSSSSRLATGASSEGEFWESLNWACSRKLPVFYVVEDNGYAISVPVDVQTAGRQHFAPGEGLSAPPGAGMRRHRISGEL